MNGQLLTTANRNWSFYYFPRRKKFVLIKIFHSRQFPNPRPEECSERDMAAVTVATVYLISPPKKWYFPGPKSIVLLNKATQQSLFLLPFLDLLFFSPFLRPTLLGQRVFCILNWQTILIYSLFYETLETTFVSFISVWASGSQVQFSRQTVSHSSDQLSVEQHMVLFWGIDLYYLLFC